MPDPRFLARADPSAGSAQDPIQSYLTEDGNTELVFPDGTVARIPSAIVRDALGRGLDIGQLIAATGNFETNLLLGAVLRELVALRRMAEITNDLDASDLVDGAALGPT